MSENLRIIDANINRVCEGIRVLEDLARFYLENGSVTEDLRNLRHRIRKTVEFLQGDLFDHRDSVSDIGLVISGKTKLDDKASIEQVVFANSKRVQEGLRVIEENLKVLGYYNESKVYEQARYKAYELEKALWTATKVQGKRQRLTTDIYAITSEAHSGGKSNLQVTRELIDAGVKILQYREKEKPVREIYHECLEIRKLTKAAGVTFIVNDYIDIALLVDADGVHIGQDDLPIELVRRLVGADKIIGLSTHSPEQASDAIQRGADYIGVGPIYGTATKLDVGPVVGVDYLDFVVKNTTIPHVAIGGIKVENLAEVLSTGATCVAMISELVGAADIGAKVREIREIFQAVDSTTVDDEKAR